MRASHFNHLPTIYEHDTAIIVPAIEPLASNNVACFIKHLK